MVGDGETRPQDDEVILRVPYTTFTSWLVGIASLAIVPLCLDVAYGYAALRGDYISAAVLFFGCLVFLVNGVEVLFTKHILFYQDRLVKVWHLLGRRTIPYAKAKLLANPGYLQYLGRAYTFREINNRGKAPFTQVPILFMPRYVSSEMAKKVESAITYLVGIEDNSKPHEKTRVFVKPTLPKEVVSDNRVWIGFI